MITSGGANQVVLDEKSCEQSAPYGIITADCSSPREFDDGIAVNPLEASSELYRASVFAVDTSDLYQDDRVTRRVIQKTESRYSNSHTTAESYDPMLPERLVKDRHFVQGTNRKALVVGFTIGASQPPTDVTIGFGRVEVLKNYNYAKFGEKCRYAPSFEPFARVAALIIGHLHNSPEEIDIAHRSLLHVPRHNRFKRGSDINQAFMVAANYVVAKSVLDYDAAIYRTHDIDTALHTDFMDARLARYSTTPGPHTGLGLDVYTRVTSPLRRAEDFIMHGLLRARHEGRPLNSRDHRNVKNTVQRLNQRVMSDLFLGQLRPSDEDNWEAV